MDIKPEFVVTHTPPPPPLQTLPNPFATRQTLPTPPPLTPFSIRQQDRPPLPPRQPTVPTTPVRRTPVQQPNIRHLLLHLPTTATMSATATPNRSSSSHMMNNCQAPSTNPPKKCCRNKCCAMCCPVIQHNLFHIQSIVRAASVDESVDQPIQLSPNVDHCSQSSSFQTCKKASEIGVGINGSLMQRARWVRKYMVENKKGYVRSVDRDAIVKLIDDLIIALKK